MFGQQQTSTPLQQTTGQQQQQRPTLVAFGQQYSNTPSSSTGGGLFGASTSSQQQQPQQPQQQQQPMFGAQSNAGAGGANATGSSTPFGASALFSQQHHQGTPQHQQQQPQQAQQQHQSPWGTASYPHQPAAASPFANNSSSFGATAGAPPSNAHAGMFGSPAHPQGAYQQQPQQYAFQQSQGQHLQQQQQPLPGQGMQLKDAPQPRVYMAGYLSSGAAHQHRPATAPPASGTCAEGAGSSGAGGDMHDDLRMWDSPASKGNAASPSRFGTGSLFGSRGDDFTPSKSPLMGSLSGRDGGSARRGGAGSGDMSSVEDDAPPALSLDDADRMTSAGTSVTDYPFSSSPKKAPMSYLPSPSKRGPSKSVSDSGGTEQQQESFAVTVFGFPPHLASDVASHFATIGTVVAVLEPGSLQPGAPPAGANWLIVAYAQAWAAARALRRNGEVVGAGALMLGVKADDPQIIAAAGTSEPTLASAAGAMMPNGTGATGTSTPAAGSSGAVGTPNGAAQSSRAQSSGIGRPVPVVGSTGAFLPKPVKPKASSFFSSLGGTPTRAGEQQGSDAAAASLFAERQRQAILQQQQSSSAGGPAGAPAQAQGGILGRLSDAVFGW